MTVAHSNLTVDSILESTTHDRLRRAERQIDKITLQEARRYGMSEPTYHGRIKYTYAGHVFIYDPVKNRAITSWKIDSKNPKKPAKETNKNAKTKKKDPTSGTRFFKPLLIGKSTTHEDKVMREAHDDMTHTVRQHPEKWTSHTVLVVDMSGSMREDDVNGARCRSDGVWTVFAREYVKGQLEGKKCSVYDVVSVVLMQETARVVIGCEPITYVLYNKLVDFREWQKIKPQGHGFYGPALEKAEELLELNSSGACSLTLLFFSDGKPSDFYADNEEFDWRKYKQVNNDLIRAMGRIGSRFGRRLNISCVGMADKEENFKTLEFMAREASLYGAQSKFTRPELDSEALSQIMSSTVASSLASKLELATGPDKKGRNFRSVRKDIEREKQDAPDDLALNDNWRTFRSRESNAYVLRAWTWSVKHNDFVRIIDTRCAVCFRKVADSDYDVFLGRGSVPTGELCRGCRACFFCARCIQSGQAKAKHSLWNGACPTMAANRRRGKLIGGHKCPLSMDVAWKKQAFGEGAERLAFKFRFLNAKGKFTGPIMVAKESRFVEDVDHEGRNYLNSDLMLYHKSFLRTQATAARYANLFNKIIREIDEVLEFEQYVPMIEFVEPTIFELQDDDKGRTYNVLVEPMIPGKYEKFTGNFGNAPADVKRHFYVENEGVDLSSAAMLLGRNPEEALVPAPANGLLAEQDLGVIAEGSEDEDEDDYSVYAEEENDDFELWNEWKETDVLEAFSHFTFVESTRNLMVVDLQGALRTNEYGERQFLLTDPAIHHRRLDKKTKRQFGRTDLGPKGMRAFFECHKCNRLCQLLEYRELNDPMALDRLFKKKSVSSVVDGFVF